MLTWLELVKAELRQRNPSVAEDAFDERFILDKIDKAVARFERETRRFFSPRIATKFYDTIPFSRRGAIDSDGILWLGRDLLEVTTLTDDETVLTTDDYALYPSGDGSRERIRRTNSGVWTIPSDPLESISIAGIWGYHEDYGQAWVASGDTLQEALNSSSGVVKVLSIAGEDARFSTPRFSPGMLLKIDSEYMQIRKVDMTASPDQLSVFRGLNGSVAASHLISAPISIWYADEIAQSTCTKVATLWYQRRGQFESSSVEGFIEKRWPKDLTDEMMRGVALRKRQLMPGAIR